MKQSNPKNRSRYDSNRDSIEIRLNTGHVNKIANEILLADVVVEGNGGISFDSVSICK